MRIKITKLDERAELPTYANPSDAGLDLYSVEDAWLHGGQRKLIKCGIALEIPDNHVGLVHPRSGLAHNHGITVLNAPGTIDAGYRGEIMVNLYNTSDQSYHVYQGDRIAQLVIQRVEHVIWDEVAKLSGSQRAKGGHGSSG